MGWKDIKLDWKFFLTAVLALAGVLVPLLIWQWDTNPHAITARLISSVALQPRGSSSIDELQVTLDGVKVQDPYLSAVQIVNSGAKPIAATDFEGPLDLTVLEPIRLVKARVVTTDPPGIPVAITFSPSGAQIKPLLLNPGDTLTLSLISSGGQPTFEAQGRISGVKKLNNESNLVKHPGWLEVANVPLAGISLVLYVIFMMAVLDKWIATNGRWITVSTVLVLAVTSARLISQSLTELGLEVSLYNVFAFALISLTAGAPLMFCVVKKAMVAQRVDRAALERQVPDIDRR
jgi:hypothetical protein